MVDGTQPDGHAGEVPAGRDTDGPAVVRAARPEDAPAIAALGGQLGYPAGEQAVRQTLTALLADPEQLVVVLDEPGRGVLGWLHLALARRIGSGRLAEVVGLVVDADRRNRGHGQALMRHAARWAATRGAARLRVRTRVERDGALRFYERLGLAPLKTQTVLECELPVDDPA